MTGALDTALDYAYLLSITCRDDKVQEFDERWDDILLSMHDPGVRSPPDGRTIAPMRALLTQLGITAG